jgi:hypothetical protein
MSIFVGAAIITTIYYSPLRPWGYTWLFLRLAILVILLRNAFSMALKAQKAKRSIRSYGIKFGIIPTA